MQFWAVTETKGPFTLHQIFGTARIQMVRVPKSRVRFIHLHFNFSRAKQFYFCVWYANQTQMFVQDSVSRITSTQYACVLCCFKIADGEFLEDFLFNFFKRRRLAYRKLEQFLNVSIRWLSLLSWCSHYQYYCKLHYTVEPLLSGHPLSGHPLLSGQLSKSRNYCR